MAKIKPEIDAEWPGIPADVRASILGAWDLGVPAMATALYGRWWQFETWLRSLVYVELKAAFGPTWDDQLPGAPQKRQDREKQILHMTTPDSQARLAYTDVSGLLTIINSNWGLFEPSLISKNIWAGRIEELRHIRNRIGHCRRPHADDLMRLEQMLRDLEGGAFVALSAFNRQSLLEGDRNEALVDAWVHRKHEVANRLLDHAARQYKTDFHLSWSRRPWSKPPSADIAISSEQGFIWHAEWMFRGDHSLNLGDFWTDASLDPWREAILFVCASSSSAVEVSFASMEEPQVVADAIGCCFDAVIRHQRRGRDADVDYTTWARSYENLDPRVQAGGPWSIVDDSTTPITIFGA